MTTPGYPAPRITTVIPTYRRPRLLRRAVTSALEQQGAPLQVRVFDNASGDETGTMIGSIAAQDTRLHYQCHVTNIGGIANFDFALRSVDTPFFSILSDDDYLLPGFYQRALEELDANPEVMFWVGMTLHVDEQGKIFDARVDRWAREGLFVPPDGLLPMTHGTAPSWTGILFRREVLERLGYPDPEALGPSDFDFILRAAMHYPFILRKHACAVFTLNTASFSATQPLSSFWPGWQKMFRNIESNDSIDENAKQALLGALHADAQRMLFRRGVNALGQSRYEFARGAAEALQGEYHGGARATLLRALSWALEHVPLLQPVYAGCYRWMERRLVASRSDLEPRFAHLIKQV